MKKIILIILGGFLCNASSSQQIDVDNVFETKIKHIEEKNTVRDVHDFVSLVKRFASTDMEKVKFVFYWISKNVKYDWERYNSLIEAKGYTKISLRANDIISKKRGVCQDFALLGKVVLDSLGINSEIVYGIAKSRVQDVQGDEVFLSHAWNSIYLDNRWLIVDFTWASMTSEGNPLKTFFFDPHPEKFIFSHYPFDPKWALVKNIPSKEDFLQQPIVDWSVCNDVNVENFSTRHYLEKGHLIIILNFKLDDQFLIEATTITGDFINYLNPKYIETKERLYHYKIELPKKLKNSLVVSIKRLVNIGGDNNMQAEKNAISYLIRNEE